MTTQPGRARGGTLRRRLLSAHRWLGIILGVYFVMLGITGSLLVFAREIDRALNPELLTAPPQGERQPLSAIVDTFRREYPDRPMSYVNYPLPPDGVFNVRSGPNQASQLSSPSPASSVCRSTGSSRRRTQPSTVGSSG